MFIYELKYLLSSVKSLFVQISYELENVFDQISMILHGEEGMSETRELISEDNRPMFERNSRDRFIMT